MVERNVLKSWARRNMTGRDPNVYLVALVYLLIGWLLSFLSGRLIGTTESITAYTRAVVEYGAYTDLDTLLSMAPRIAPVAALLSLAISIAGTVLAVGWRFYCLRTSRGETGTYSDLFAGFERFGKVLWLAIIIGFFTLLWALLFLIPAIAIFILSVISGSAALIGLVFLLMIAAMVVVVIITLRYGLAYFVLLDNPGFRAIECLNESKRLMKGHVGYAFVLNLSFLGWMLLAAAIAFLLGMIHPYLGMFSPFMIWLAPYMNITFANFYNVLTGHQPPMTLNEPYQGR